MDVAEKNINPYVVDIAPYALDAHLYLNWIRNFTDWIESMNANFDDWIKFEWIDLPSPACTQNPKSIGCIIKKKYNMFAANDFDLFL